MFNKISLQQILIVFSLLGNTIEFYGITIYGIFTPLFAEIFFVTNSKFLSLVISWLGFGVTFFARPLGAIIFGYLGDKYSRKFALTLSILLMSCALLVIGILPTYENIGILHL